VKRPFTIYYLLFAVIIPFVLSGCIVRTYPLTKDRIDQDLETGNRGYLKGEAPQPGERKTTRTTRVVEIEIGSPIKFERLPQQGPKDTSREEIMPASSTDEDLTQGNRGYIFESQGREIVEPQVEIYEKYTVQKNDTLQKVSQKYYGTTKNWKKIYDANKDTLKSPGKIYPGQVINVPVESLKEPRENLK
jgi:nucleoid-associated protein YgaU